MNTDIAWCSYLDGTGYWAVAIDTEYEKRFSSFDSAQDYQDALICDLGL